MLGVVCLVFAYPFQDTVDFASSWAQRVVGAEGFSAGSFVTTADMDGDLWPDLIVGCPGANKLYVIYGPVPDTFDLLWPSSRYTVIQGKDSLGASAGAGDFNNDGYMDLAFSSLGGNGTLFIALGPLADSLDTRQDPWSQRIVVCPGLYARSYLGSCFAVGDFNGDGYDDLAVGAPGSSFLWRESAGEVYMVMGRERFSPVEYLDAWHNIKVIMGAFGYDFLGRALATGDFNGDGYDDLAVGAPGLDYRQEAGGFMVFYGQDTIPDTVDMVYPQGIRMSLAFGELEYGGLGNSLSVGDFNHDGIPDLATGAFTFGEPQVNAGRAYVLYFPMEAGTLDIATAHTRISRIVGSQSNAFLGWGVYAGDVNGDARSDLLVSAPLFDPDARLDAGQAYLILSPFDDTIPVDSGPPGLHWFWGAASRDELGRSLHLADMNLDGQADVIVGAPFAESFGGRQDGGVVYIVEDSVHVGTREPRAPEGRVFIAGACLRVQGVQGPARLRVHDVSGRARWDSGVVLSGSDSIGLPGLEPGVYFVSLKAPGLAWRGKWVVR